MFVWYFSMFKLDSQWVKEDDEDEGEKYCKNKRMENLIWHDLFKEYKLIVLPQKLEWLAQASTKQKKIVPESGESIDPKTVYVSSQGWRRSNLILISWADEICNRNIRFLIC